jgi:cytochrome c-type biogenesis protein
MHEVTFGLALAAGLLSFVSPCVLPLVPAYIGYMGGRMTHTVATTGKSKSDSISIGTRFSTLVHGIAFVLGFTVIFVSVGLATTALFSTMGQAAQIVEDILARVGGVIIIVFGLYFMGVFKSLFQQMRKHPHWLNSVFTACMAVLLSGFFIWGFITPVLFLPAVTGLMLALVLGGAFQHPQDFWLNSINSIESMLYADTRATVDPNKASSLSGSFLMGMVFSAGWTPCVGPIFGGITTMATQTGNILLGGALLGTYSLGLGIPFLLTALMLDGAQNLFRRIQKYMHKIEIVSGLLLIVIGLAVATGSLQNLSQNVSTEQADFSYRIEACGTEFVRGGIAFDEINTCLDGHLVPVAVGERARAVFTPETTAITQRFELDEAGAIGIELTHVDSLPNDLSITLQTRDGDEIASSDTFTPIPDTDDEFIVLDARLLTAGTYDVVMSASPEERTTFRLNITRATSAEVDTSNQTSGALEELAEQGSIETGLEVGMRAPDFTVTTLAGEEVSLSDLRGQAVLINFWGTWCGPCIREMPELQDAYEDYQDEGFLVLGLAVRDSRESVLEFKDEYGIEFPLALDTGSEVTDLYLVNSQPSTFIVDENGVIVFRFMGAIVRSQIDEVLQNDIGLELN